MADTTIKNELERIASGKEDIKAALIENGYEATSEEGGVTLSAAKINEIAPFIANMKPGVNSINNLKGDITLQGGDNVSISNTVNTFTISADVPTKIDELVDNLQLAAINSKINSGLVSLYNTYGDRITSLENQTSIVNQKANGFYAYNGVIDNNPTPEIEYSSYNDSNTQYPYDYELDKNYPPVKGQMIIDQNGVIYSVPDPENSSSCTCVYVPNSGSGTNSVESVNGKTGVVVLKTSDLENDSNYIKEAITSLNKGTEKVVGDITIGDGLLLNGNTLSSATMYLSDDTTEYFGEIKLGRGLSIDENRNLNSDAAKPLYRHKITFNFSDENGDSYLLEIFHISYYETILHNWDNADFLDIIEKLISGGGTEILSYSNFYKNDIQQKINSITVNNNTFNINYNYLYYFLNGDIIEATIEEIIISVPTNSTITTYNDQSEVIV